MTNSCRIIAFVAALSLAACTPHETKTVERAPSPLIGTWTRDGSTPKSSGNGPQFTTLKFKADGTLSASYVAGGIGAAIGSSPSVKSENDNYTTSGEHSLSIAEGTSHREYTYRVDGSKLYLTAPGNSDAAVFTKAG